MNELSSAFSTVAEVLSLALFLSLVNERVLEFVIKPTLERIARWLGQPAEAVSNAIPFVAMLMGGLISYGFGLDLFAPLATAVGLEPAAWVTKLLTALVVAGGSNLLHDIWPSGQGAARNE